MNRAGRRVHSSEKFPMLATRRRNEARRATIHSGVGYVARESKGAQVEFGAQSPRGFNLVQIWILG